MVGLLGGREESQGLLGDPRKLQALLGYEGMPTPDAAEGMPQYDPEFLKRLGNAIATMPTVQAVKSGLTLPGDVYAGRQPMGLPSETEDLSRVADLAGLAMTGGIGGVASGAVPKDAVGMFGGKLAKTADHAALAKAEALAQSGADQATIWKETGWFKGKDDKWKFEIPDNKAEMLGGVQKRLNEGLSHWGDLDDALYHPELYKAYPDMRKTQFEAIDRPLVANRGAYTEKDDVVALFRKEGMDSTTLHELQHAVQAREGFGRGGNPEAAADALYSEINKRLSDLAKRMDSARGDEKAALKAEYNSLMDEKLSASAMDLYRRQAGEVEARNVQSRQSMTPEERQARPPWETEDVPRDRQITRGLLLGSTSTDRKGAAALSQGLLGNREPIRAYHGSPHDFDRFDLSKIGTGEGAQAYGHGLYFAENEGVARGYRDTLEAKHNIKLAGESLQNLQTPDLKGATRQAYYTLMHKNGDIDAAIKDAAGAMNPEEIIPILEGWKAQGVTKQPGRMYEVAIHADPERFLDWDKPLGEQGIARTVLDMLPPLPHAGRDHRLRDTGSTIYNNINRPQRVSGTETTAEASTALREAGIPGIKYLDAGSRAAGDGSRNYVLFDDQIVEILRKYGVSSIAALPPAVQAAIQLSQEQQSPSQ